MALYLPDLDALFIHVPHTGGTWVRRCLEESGLAVQPAQGPGDHGLPEAYQAARFRFTFVRYPTTWIESVWRKQKHLWPKHAEMPPLAAEKSWSPLRILSKRCSANQFSSFVWAVCRNEPSFVSRMFESYAGPRGWPKVNAVGHTEKLAEHLQAIMRQAGFRGTLADVAPENVSEEPLPRWDDEVLLDEFMSLEAASLQRWYCQTEPHFVELA